MGRAGMGGAKLRWAMMRSSMVAGSSGGGSAARLSTRVGRYGDASGPVNHRSTGLSTDLDGIAPPPVVWAGSLHDVGRSPLLAGDAREHNELSALVLAAEGLPACAEIARRHPVYAVLDPATAPRTLRQPGLFFPHP